MNELLEIISQLDEEQQERLLQMAKDILANKPFALPEEEEEEREGEPVSSPYYDVHQLSYSAEDIRAIVGKFPKKKKWTFADLQNTYIFPAECGVKIELINYKIYIMDPSYSHQKILTLLSAHLTMHVSLNNLGEVTNAPVAIKIDEGNVMKPDILYIALRQIQDKTVEITENNGVTGAPELVVEVISPANYKKLRHAKKKRYAEAGVTEYWELKPKKKSITVEVLENGEYKLFSEAKKTGTIQSSFSVDIEKIFV
ncbi:MAG: Uma2 family endonuclease [Bacteroidetes bacterium]|nr:MAG: Uma2 family endonuclease [Bacteroidota bacterium]